MQKFKAGDLIIKNGKFYFARLVGEKETLFDEIEIFGFEEGAVSISGYSTFGQSRSMMIDHLPENCSTGICQPKNFNPKTGRIETQVSEGTYPIMGKVDVYPGGGAPLLDMPKLARYYPELTMRYTGAIIRNLQRRIDAPWAQPQPSTGTGTITDSTGTTMSDEALKALHDIPGNIAQSLHKEGFSPIPKKAPAKRAPRKAPRKQRGVNKLS